MQTVRSVRAALEALDRSKLELSTAAPAYCCLVWGAIAHLREDRGLRHSGAAAGSRPRPGPTRVAVFDHVLSY
jgi:hypothetical protein